MLPQHPTIFHKYPSTHLDPNLWWQVDKRRLLVLILVLWSPLSNHKIHLRSSSKACYSIIMMSSFYFVVLVTRETRLPICSTLRVGANFLIGYDLASLCLELNWVITKWPDHWPVMVKRFTEKWKKHEFFVKPFKGGK